MALRLLSRALEYSLIVFLCLHEVLCIHPCSILYHYTTRTSMSEAVMLSRERHMHTSGSSVQSWRSHVTSEYHQNSGRVAVPTVLQCKVLVGHRLTTCSFFYSALQYCFWFGIHSCCISIINLAMVIDFHNQLPSLSARLNNASRKRNEAWLQYTLEYQLACQGCQLSTPSKHQKGAAMWSCLCASAVPDLHCRIIQQCMHLMLKTVWLQLQLTGWSYRMTVKPY